MEKANIEKGDLGQSSEFIDQIIADNGYRV